MKSNLPETVYKLLQKKLPFIEPAPVCRSRQEVKKELLRDLLNAFNELKQYLDECEKSEEEDN